MAKKQIYSFVFNTQQSDAYNAMYNVGFNFNENRDIVHRNMLNGDIYEEKDPYLSEDAMTLNVERIWSDKAFDELMAVTTVQEIIDQVNALGFVLVQRYEFVDV